MFDNNLQRRQSVLHGVPYNLSSNIFVIMAIDVARSAICFYEIVG